MKQFVRSSIADGGYGIGIFHFVIHHFFSRKTVDFILPCLLRLFSRIIPFLLCYHKLIFDIV